MGFTDLDNTAPAKVDVPPAGIVCGSRAAGRGDSKTRYIAIMIGNVAAKAIGFHLPRQMIAVRAGNGQDVGRLAIVVDAKGKFQGKKQKAGHYLVTIAANTARGQFRLDFEKFTIENARIVPAGNGNPPMLIINMPEAMRITE